MNVRDAIEHDLDAICAIYDHEVDHETSTMDTVPWRVEERGRTVLVQATAAHPLLVADDEGIVRGWGRLIPWSPKRGYARTAEVSVFVAAEARRRGVGRALLRALVARARDAGHATLLGRIEASNTASRALFADEGFVEVGTMRAVGEKFGRVLDVVLVQILFDELPRTSRA